MLHRYLLGLAPLLIASPALAQQDFRACMDGLRPSAAKAGISERTFNAAMQGVQPDMSLLDSLNFQPEFKTPIWDYITGLVDEERVEDGRAAMQRWGQALAAAEKRYGVSRYVIAGVWGVESDFGQAMGTKPLIQSLATLSCYGRRQSFFRGEFIATLRIVQNGDIAPEQLKGSWAGAFGHTQFMPSTFHRLAVDLDGDGRRDVVNSIPDAVGSTANFLKKAGWSDGLPWGYEVNLPKGFNTAAAGRDKKKRRPASDWGAAGVTRLDGQPVSGNYNAGILIPAGINGPAFLITKNFDAIYSYNAAESYGLAIGLLADRLRGRPGIQAPWPTDDPPLTREQRRELQRRLTAQGYDVGEPDGKIGSKTREAIKSVEQQLGMRPTGRAGGKVLNALR